VVDIVAESIRNNRAWIDTLKNFVLRIHYSAFPIGFIGCPYRESFYRSPSVLLESGFKEIVSRENLWFIEYVGMESGIYKVWGQYYACKILMMVAPEEAIDVLKQLRVTLCKVKYNKNTTPVFMITNMLLNEILLQTAYCSNISIMNMLLSDNEESFRALGVLMLIYHSKYCNEIDMEDGLGKIRDSNELIHTCEMALEIQLDDARKDVYCTKLLAAYQDSSSGSKVLEYFKKIITIQSRNSRKSAGEEYRVFSEEYKLLYVERIITPLISAGFVTKEAVKNIVIEVLFLHIGEPLTQYNGSWAQLLLSTGCNLSECYDRMRLFLDKFVESVSKMDLKNDDTIYRESFPLQKLKGLSMDILRIYGDATPYCISDLLKEINNLLEKYEIS
jgi:hypothetical protein